MYSFVFGWLVLWWYNKRKDEGLKSEAEGRELLERIKAKG